MPKVERLEIDSQVANLSKIEAWIDSFCESHFPAVEYRHKMHLVIEELFMNAVMHGYGGDREDGPIWLALHPLPEGAALVIEDDAPPFNVLEEGPAPDTQSGVEDRPIGGLGIMLVRNMADHVSYDYDKRNRITTVFGRGPPPGGGAEMDAERSAAAGLQGSSP
ncbi:MAG: ATP-binding protein [Boseongicola sp.]|nr:ATP-binding protein [Boseongicola sp.]